MLYEIMVQAGPLVSLSIPKMKNYNIHRGYGFAEYTIAESAEYAVKLFSGLVSLYGQRLVFKIAGTKNNCAPLINQEAHGLSHKYQFSPPTLKSCVAYCMPFILPNPHLAAHEQKVSSGHLAPSTQVTKAKRKSRFESKTSARTAINDFVNDNQPKPKRWDTDRHFVNDNEPEPKRWDTDRRNSSEAIEIQRISY